MNSGLINKNKVPIIPTDEPINVNTSPTSLISKSAFIGVTQKRLKLMNTDELIKYGTKASLLRAWSFTSPREAY
jgi:hypothetical protein